MITYDIFWKTLKKKHISQYALVKDYKVSNGLLDLMRKNQPISLNNIDRFCNILHCSIQDVVEIKSEET